MASTSSNASPTAQHTHRVLLLANEALPTTRLLEELRDMQKGRDLAVLVVAPALASSRFTQAMGDVDGPREKAVERLEGAVRELRGQGFDVAGQVGDSDPRLAIEDALRAFDADELVISTHSEADAEWFEHDLVREARENFDLPVTHLVVDNRDPQRVTDVETLQPTPEQPRDPQDLPNMPRKDVAAIVVGMIGTIVLFILAADAFDARVEHQFETVVRSLLAGWAFFVTLFHVLGILLFASIGYRGMWERWTVWMMLLGIPIAAVVSLLV